MRSIAYITGLLLTIGVFNIALGQNELEQRVLQGTVMNQNQAPIEAVSIINQRTKETQKTNRYGRFNMNNVFEGDTILFKHLSYRDTLIVFDHGDNSLFISLRSFERMIEEVEVINTGYDILPKERSTGSFAFVSNNRINEQINFNIIDRLPAVASGVMLDRNSKQGTNQLLVRGMSTILGETAPLIVLDNFPYEGDLTNINPDDIENITVLRDAAAASIWGAKAANGVIVITSKKAKQNQQLTANFSSLTSIESRPNLFDLDVINSSDMIAVESMLFEKGYYNSMINSSSKPVLSPVVELLIKRSNTNDPIVINTIDSELERLGTLDVRNDFLKYVYQPGFQQQNTLGLSQGSETFIWNASASTAIVKDNLDRSIKRNTFLTNSRIHVGQKLVIDAGINISFLNSQSGKLGYGDISAYNSGLFPYAELADANGNALPVSKNWRSTYLENEIHSELLDWKYYPLEDYKHSIAKESNQNTLLTAGAEYALPSWFKVSVKYQFQKQNGVSENLKKLESYEARNMINSYATVNTTTGAVEFQVPKGGLLDRSNSNRQAHNIRGQLNFNWENPLHKVYGLIGTEVRSVSMNSTFDRLYGYNPDNLSFVFFDITKPYKSYINGANSTLPNVIALNSKKDRFISTFFNGSYTFLDKYTATMSARRDASNLFGLNVNDKWNPFWSAGLAWIISKENFWGDNLISYLKFRATYGRTGNLNPAMVALTTIRYVGANPYTQTPYARFDNYANPELKWETVGVTNIGLDFATQNNRISGTIEGYHKKGDDLYGIAPMDYTSGIPSFLVKNVASMSAYGIDLTLNTINTKGSVKWHSNVVLSHNKDKVTKYHVESESASQFVGPTNRITGREGYPVYSMYSYRWMGLDPNDGAPLGDLDGMPSREYRLFTGANATVDDLLYNGRVQPSLFGSLGNTFTWKEWSMTFRMTYKFKYSFRRETIIYSSLFSRWSGHGDYNKRWKQPGDELHTDIPAMLYPVPSSEENFYRYAEPFVERGDHIRLDYINLSYHFPNNGRGMVWLKDATITFNINNLGIIYRKNRVGIDPDYSSASSTGISPSTIYSFTLKCAL